MNLLKEAAINWGDLFWLQTSVLFAGKPDVEIGISRGSVLDPIGGWIKVFISKGLIEYGDFSGTCVYRIEYDIVSDCLWLKKGTDRRLLSHPAASPKEYRQIRDAFRDHVRSSVDEVLLG
jgi:hypothetical protein